MVEGLNIKDGTLENFWSMCIWCEIEPGDLLYSDVWNPISHSPFLSMRYFVTFKNVATSARFIYFMWNKVIYWNMVKSIAGSTICRYMPSDKANRQSQGWCKRFCWLAPLVILCQLSELSVNLYPRRFGPDQKSYLACVVWMFTIDLQRSQFIPERPLFPSFYLFTLFY